MVLYFGSANLTQLIKMSCLIYDRNHAAKVACVFNKKKATPKQSGPKTINMKIAYF